MKVSSERAFSRRLIFFVTLATLLIGLQVRTSRAEIEGRPGATTLTAQTEPQSTANAGRSKVLIAFANPPGPAEEALVRSAGGEIKYTYHLIPAIAAAIPDAAIEGLLQNPRVTRIDPDLPVRLADAELDNTWGVKRIGSGTVHAGGNRGTGVKVAVLDTGIDTDHPDLNYDPTCSASFVTSEPTIEDGHGHGTHVAGTVAALDDDNGVVGVAPEAILCIYKVFDGAGNSNYSDIAAAIERAVEDGVRVTNNSYGSDEDPGPTIKAAFDNAYAAGVLHVGGAGNNGNILGLSDNCIYPALWDSVMATSATTESDSLDMMSSICPEMELAAPGANINSTLPGGGYGTKSGTSMASPHVAGTAALVLAANPGWSNDAVRTQLHETAEDLGAAGRDDYYGYGLVDAEAAAVASPNNPPVAEDQSVTTDEDASVAITLTASDPDGDSLTYSVVAGPSDGSLSGAPPDLTYTPDQDFNGTDSFTFKANDGTEDSNTATVSISVAPVNDPPQADDQSVTTEEDTPVAITLTASDPDGDSLTFSVVTGPNSGSLSGTAPELTYTPDLAFTGDDSFTFKANDGTEDSNTATVSISVSPVNNPPVADDQSVTTEEDTSVAITLTATDPDGDSLTFSVVTGPSSGSLSGTAPDLTYMPNQDFNGADEFTFKANDGKEDSNTATVSISVSAVNDAPVAAFTYGCTNLACDFDATDSADPDGTIVGYSWDFGDGNTGSGVTVSHTFAAAGSYTATLTVTDGGDLTDSESQQVVVSEASPIHVGNLEGMSLNNGKTWRADVTVSIHDGSHQAVAEATVSGTWSGGWTGAGGCTTGADGTCSVGSGEIPKNADSAVFTVDDVSHTTLTYDAAANHDPDGNSSGTAIQVNKDGTTADPGTPTNEPPVASFTYSCTDLTCSFDASGSSDSDGSIVTYEWDFGDNNSDSGITPVHTYAAPGTYTVILTVTDDAGATDSNPQDIAVSDGSEGIALTAIGYKVKGVHHVDLTWGGAGSTEVDIYRDGLLIGTTANDGFYTDNTGNKGGGTYTYRVCETGSATCSNDAIVEF